MCCFNEGCSDVVRRIDFPCFDFVLRFRCCCFKGYTNDVLRSQFTERLTVTRVETSCKRSNKDVNELDFLNLRYIFNFFQQVLMFFSKAEAIVSKTTGSTKKKTSLHFLYNFEKSINPMGLKISAISVSII